MFVEERSWQKGLRTGEFIREWKGFTPFFLGCFYGNDYKLGGEDEFSHCYDFFSGVCDVDWWIVAEIDKLTKEQQNRMLFLMRRNKWVYDLVHVKEIIDHFTLTIVKESYAWHRLGSYLNYEYIRTHITRYVKYSHIKLPKVEDIDEKLIETNVNLLIKKPDTTSPMQVNIECNPIVKIVDINEGNAFVPSDIFDIMKSMDVFEGGYFLDDIKKNTKDKMWKDSFNISKEDLF